MRINRIVLCAAILLPLATGVAQRRGGGGGGGAPGARPATLSQIEDLNPARMLIDKRKKIGLADSTVNQLKALDKKIIDRNKALMTQYDSVRREMRFPNSGPAAGSMASGMGSGGRRSAGGGDPIPGAGGGSGPTQSPEDAERLRTQMQALSAIGAQIRERRTADLAELLALLTPDQAEKAKEFVTEQSDEFDKAIPARR